MKSVIRRLILPDGTDLTKEFGFGTPFGKAEGKDRYGTGRTTERAASCSVPSPTTTPFLFVSGSFRIATDTIEGKVVKVIECVEDGFLIIGEAEKQKPPIGGVLADG